MNMKWLMSQARRLLMLAVALVLPAGMVSAKPRPVTERIERVRAKLGIQEQSAQSMSAMSAENEADPSRGWPNWGNWNNWNNWGNWSNV